MLHSEVPAGRSVRRRDLRAVELHAIVADGDADAGSRLAAALLEHRVHVTVCTDGADALLQLGLTDPDVLLVGASLPVVGGVAIVEAVRRRTRTPVIVGVGSADSRAAAAALAAGATACVRKPYQLREILPLLQATRPDLTVVTASLLRCGSLELDDAAHEVRLSGRLVPLPLREFELLRYLLSHQDRVISPRELLDQVWGSGHSGDPSTLTVHVNRLRRRFGAAGAPAEVIQTVRGVGYRMRPVS
jgi:DNA-binding response OmpR family regulator